MTDTPLIDFEAFLARHPDAAAYARSFKCSWVVDIGFLKFAPEDAFMWSPPWPEDTVLAVLGDHTREKRPASYALKPIAYHLDEIRTSEPLSIFNFPHRLTRDIDRRTTVAGQPCERSQLTSEERDRLLASMRETERDAYDQAVEQAIVERTKALMAEPHLENPVRLHLLGMDDFSWARVFPSVAMARGALQALAGAPTRSSIDALGFIFTN